MYKIKSVQCIDRPRFFSFPPPSLLLWLQRIRLKDIIIIILYSGGYFALCVASHKIPLIKDNNNKNHRFWICLLSVLFSVCLQTNNKKKSEEIFHNNNYQPLDELWQIERTMTILFIDCGKQNDGLRLYVQNMDGMTRTPNKQLLLFSTLYGYIQRALLLFTIVLYFNNNDSIKKKICSVFHFVNNFL